MAAPKVIFPKITSESLTKRDGREEIYAFQEVANVVSKFPFIQVTDELAAGASEATTTQLFFVTPTKCEIVDAKFIITTVNTGTGNTPEVKLFEGSNEIAASGAIALGGAVGDVKALTVDTAKSTLDAGKVLKLSIINPAGTITAAIKGRLQIIWKSVI